MNTEITALPSATPARGRGERRRTPRVPLDFDGQVFVRLGGEDRPAGLTDVSTAGAGLTVSGIDHRPEIGQEIEMVIQAHGDRETRRGRIAWVAVSGTTLRFGVEFVGLCADADCIGLLNVSKIRIDPSWALRIPPHLAFRRQVLPFAFADGCVHVACANPRDTAAFQSIEKLVGYPVRPEPAEPVALQRVLDRIYGDPQATAAVQARTRSVDLRKLGELGADDVVALCDELLHAALLRQASDIHIDADAEGLVVRFRVDGALEPYRRLPPTVAAGVISRFKVLGGMDIAEKRAAQDGAFRHKYGRASQTVDLRVATLPTKYGERMTLRFLGLHAETLTLERLGMGEDDLACFSRAIDNPHGLILLTGPTGSGKTTTLYAAIRRLISTEDLNILTVEDPIESEIRGVAQSEVDHADKVTFHNALRSLLRHDPDVIMIGEIRDAETADIAIKASLTGHLVFSSLHTNSAVSVVTRLADMGLDRFLIAATLRLAVAQRLVRRLCPRCRKTRELTASEARALARPEAVGRVIYEPVGCVYCGGRGFNGRIGLFEMMPLDEDWARLISRGADEPELIAFGRERQLRYLLDDGLAKLTAGLTSIREVLKAVAIW
jgi:type II secretory ATPase GspE/PulE/Tfp pilus assembly ATPase PilB-like protein